MESILDWIRREGVIFRGGSGSGVNLSHLRSSKEQLSKGGYASGPVSFMRGADASAGTIKSGGKTRRAAKMVVLDVDHPDVEEFIWCKAREEEKARVLESAGYDMSLDSPDWASIQYQNANNSVRVTDAFMEAVIEGKEWNLTARTDGTVLETRDARDLLRQIAAASVGVRRPGRPVRHDDQQVAHAAEHGPDQGLEPVQRVHVHKRQCVQPRVAESHEVPARGRRARRRGARARGRRRLPRAGDPRRLLLVPDARDRAEREGVPPARPGLREPRRAADGARAAVRLGRGPCLRRRDHGADDRPRLPQVGGDRRAHGAVRRLPQERRRDDRRDVDAPRGGGQHRARALGPSDLLNACRQSWDDALDLGEVHGYRNAQATVLAPTGCLVGDSLVSTSRGLVRLRSLGDPVGDKWQPLDVDVATDEGPRRATQFYVNGFEQVVSVETGRGYRIQGTATHRIKVVDAEGDWIWRRFAEIREGDRVPLMLNGLIGEPKTVELPPLGDLYWTADFRTRVPRTMTPELAELVGYFMGDGSLHAKGLRFCVAEADRDVVEHLVELIAALFGLDATVTAKEGYIEVAVNSVPLTLWWEACGFAKLPPSAEHRGEGLAPAHSRRRSACERPRRVRRVHPRTVRGGRHDQQRLCLLEHGDRELQPRRADPAARPRLRDDAEDR